METVRQGEIFKDTYLKLKYKNIFWYLYVKQ